MTLRSRIDRGSNTYKSFAAYYARENPASDMYDLLKSFYLNNGLYDEIYNALYVVGKQGEDIRPLRNPAYRTVEFYAGKLWPGPLPGALQIVTQNKAIVAPIQKVWEWSNWAQLKQRAARWAGIYGDVFFKVEKPKGKDTVYFLLIEPQYVTDFETDERGFMSWTRIDIPRVRRVDDKPKAYTYTEVWSKITGTVRIWEHEGNAQTEVSYLGDPGTEKSITSVIGHDFIPIVHGKLRDIGEDRGMGAFTQEIDKINEANRMATRLHQMLWRYDNPIWALRANQVSSDGRPLPAPRIDKNSDSEIELGGDKMIRLPGNSVLDPLIPNISWSDSLAILQDHMLELEHDLPELAYWRLRDVGELSGKAVQLLLGDAIDKVMEARGNLEGTLERVDAMALSIGQHFGIFDGLGTFEEGAFIHSFEAREVIPTPEVERAATVQQYIAAGIAKQSAMSKAGWTDEQIKAEAALAKKEQAEKQRAFEQNMLASERMLGQQAPGISAEEGVDASTSP